MKKIDQIYISQTTAGYQLSAGLYKFACVIGQSGLVTADKKTEGDGATPIGSWLLRGLFYRPDRTDADLIRQTSLMPCFGSDPPSSHQNSKAPVLSHVIHVQHLIGSGSR